MRRGPNTARTRMLPSQSSDSLKGWSRVSLPVEGGYMRSRLGQVVIVLASALAMDISVAADGPPVWAYGVPASTGAVGNPPGGPAAGRGAQPPQAADSGLKRVPGSSLEFTLTQIRDGFGPADWFPGDHRGRASRYRPGLARAVAPKTPRSPVTRLAILFSKWRISRTASERARSRGRATQTS